MAFKIIYPKLWAEKFSTFCPRGNRNFSEVSQGQDFTLVLLLKKAKRRSFLLVISYGLTEQWEAGKI